MKVTLFLVAFFVSGFVCITNAAEKLSAIQLNAATGDLSGQIDVILEKIQTSEYIEMSKNDRVELTERLTEIESETLDAASVAIAQKEVNEILTKAFADSKLVCTNREILGTRKKTKSCMTVAEKKAEKEKTKNNLQQDSIQSLNRGAPLDSNN